MRNFSLALALILMGWAMPVWAACPTGYKLRSVGNVTGTTNTTILSGRGAEIYLIIGTCAGTACVPGLYNNDGINSDITADDVVIEPGAAASTTFVVPANGMFPAPLQFPDGVHFIGNNVAAVQLYECRP